MATSSDYFLCFLNILTLFISMLIVVQVSDTTEIIDVHGTAACASFLKIPIFILGVSLLIISVIGLLALFCRAMFLHHVYLWGTILFVVILCSFTVFSFLITDKGPEETSFGRDQGRLRDFSDWLQHHVVNENNWTRTKKCLISARICQDFAEKWFIVPIDVLMGMMLPIESGCCMPPSNCGYKFKSPTFWEAPESGSGSKDQDCRSWNNSQNVLCYDCRTCKAGYLEQLRNDWKALNVFNMFFVIYLMTILAFRFWLGKAKAQKAQMIIVSQDGNNTVKI